MIREYVYTIQEAADLLLVNRTTVKRWIIDGKIFGESIGGTVLIPRWIIEMVKDERSTRRRLRIR